MAANRLLRGQSSGLSTQEKSNRISKFKTNSQQWYQSQGRNQMGRTSGFVRRLHNTQTRNLQGFRRNMELANLLRDWG